MESSNFYELQQQQIATFSSIAAAAAQSTTPIHQWNPTPTLPLNNYEYDHYMNEILPISAQLNHINQRPNPPCTNQIINQNLNWTSNSFSTHHHHQLGWNNNNNSASPSSTNIDYVLDSVITSSSSSTSNFMTNYFNNISQSSRSNKTSACKDKVVISRTKRVSSSSQNDAALKKQRAASHSSCSLPKVVKEKIGDRIAALHRLVAPFGKTDAASVLTEALGYIQFLHHQIQSAIPAKSKTLSMSCIKPSQSNRLRCFQRVSSRQKGKECWDAKQGDLKSRGLSLVPISLAAYVSSSTSVGLD